jgi:hypothetical protein
VPTGLSLLLEVPLFSFVGKINPYICVLAGFPAVGWNGNISKMQPDLKYKGCLRHGAFSLYFGKQSNYRAYFPHGPKKMDVQGFSKNSREFWGESGPA